MHSANFPAGQAMYCARVTAMQANIIQRITRDMSGVALGSGKRGCEGRGQKQDSSVLIPPCALLVVVEVKVFFVVFKWACSVCEMQRLLTSGLTGSRQHQPRHQTLSGPREAEYGLYSFVSGK